MYTDAKKVTIWGKDYLVKFPLPGQLFEIENLKSFLTAGQYGVMARTGTIETNYLLDLVDAIATFSVLIPEIKDLLPKKSYMELDLQKAKGLVVAYRKDYEKWYQDIRNQFMTITLEEIQPEEEEHTEGE